MSTVHLCDRCGSHIETLKGINRLFHKVYFAKIYMVPNILDNRSWDYNTTLMLCDDCEKSFVKWFRDSCGKKEDTT